MPLVEELPLFEVVLMEPGPDVVVRLSPSVDDWDDGVFVEELELECELVLVSDSELESPGMSAVPRVFTCGSPLKLNLLPSVLAPCPRWRSLIELRPPPRKVFRESTGKP